jgi:hypothetical protein
MANEFIARKGLIALEDSQITGSLNVSSTLTIPGFSNVSASLAAAVAGGDNLGNHTATQDLNMGSNNITSVGNVDGVDVSALNTSVSANTTNITTLTAATSSYLISVPDGTLSGSAQIATEISGAFTAASASFSTRVTANDAKVSYTDAAVTSVINTAGVISSSAQFGSSDNVTFGTIEATSLNVTSITSSIVTSSIVQTEGSNIFGDTSADTHTFNGNITASGNISASRRLLVGSRIDLNGVDSVVNNSGTLVFGNIANVVQVRSSDPVSINRITVTNITASSDISASGTIIGSNLSGTNTGDQDLSSYIQASQTSSFSTATGVEDNADVTDTSNVTAAGALMDSELAEIATIKALTATGISGSFNAASASFSTRVTANDAKLTANTSNVTSAGALMDSELAEIATVKALTKTGISGSFTAASSSFSTRVTANDAKVSYTDAAVTSVINTAGIISSSAQIASDISGSFTAVSAALASDIASEEGSISNIVEDTTPQLGGDLDTNGKNIAFGDNDSASFGAVGDLLIFHDGSDSFIRDAGTGDLKIQASTVKISDADGSPDFITVSNTSFTLNPGNDLVNIGNNKIGNGTDQEYIEFSTTDIDFHVEDTRRLRVGDGFIDVVGNITASGNISSSGTIIAATLDAAAVSDTLAAAIVAEIDNDEIPIAKLAEDVVTVTAGTGLSGGGSVTLGNSITINSDGLLSSSAQISTDISGAFTAASASFSTRVTTNDAKVSYTDAAVTSVINTAGIISSSAQIGVGDGLLSQNNFTNADHSKLDGIEASADVTDTSNVTAAGALMDSELAEIATVKALTAAGISGSFTPASSSFSTRITTNETNITGLQTDSASFSTRVTANDAKVSYTDAAVTSVINTAGIISSSAQIGVGDGLLSQNNFTNADHTKLNGIEANADVTDTTNVTAAGALMDSEISDLALIKGLTSASISGAFDAASASLASDIPTNNNQLTNGAGYTTNTGTVTSVGTGNGLTGTITTTGNISVDYAGTGNIITNANANASGYSAADDFIIRYNENDEEVQKTSVANFKSGYNLVDTSGTPADNQIAVFTDADTIEGTSKLTFSNNDLLIHSSNADNSGIEIYGGVVGSAHSYISPVGSLSTIQFGDGETGHVFDLRRNKLAFDGDSTNTYIQADSDDPENLEIHADNNIELKADNLVTMGTASIEHRLFDTGSTHLGANGAVGDIVKFGGTTTVAGAIYYLKTDGTWANAQANAVGTATASLAVAVGTNSTTDGMCLRGFINPYGLGDASGIGSPVYLHDGFAGRFKGIAPDSTGDVVRILGYQYGSDLIYFNPSNDFIVHA